MPRIILTSLLLVLFAVLPNVTSAQRPATSPRISIVQSSASRFLEDAEVLMWLADQGRKEKVGPEFQEFVEEIFLYGIERKQPVRIDVVVGDGPTRYIPSFPIGDLDEFRENLEAFDIESKKAGDGLFELDEALEGWLRVKDGYGSIAETKGFLPANMEDPRKAVQAILVADYDLAAELVNEKTDAASQAERRKTFLANVTKELLAAVGAKDGESKAAFDLRKLGIEQQLAEIERYYADTALARIGWKADSQVTRKKVTLEVVGVKQVSGVVSILLEPIPGSELDQAVQLLNKAPNHFANVPRNADAILSLRLTSPLDALRKKHFNEFYTLLRPALKARANDRKELTAAEKQAREKLVDLVIDMLDAGAVAGNAEGFAEIVPAGKVYTGVAAVRSPNGKAADDVVKLLPEANKKIKVATAVETIGNVTVHEVTLPAAELPGLMHLFGENDKVLVGTANDAVWFAAGPNAMASLKAAIEAVAKPNEGDASDPFVDVVAKLRPWMEVRAKSAGEEGGDPALRKLVLDALATGDDTLTLQLTRKGQKVEGSLSVREGLSRVIGELMAKFTEETLLQ